MSATQTEHSGPPEAQCLARSVVDALESEPTLEAVTIDRARHTISVATLGKADLPQLTERIRDTVERTRGKDSTPPRTTRGRRGAPASPAPPLREAAAKAPPPPRRPPPPPPRQRGGKAGWNLFLGSAR